MKQLIKNKILKFLNSHGFERKSPEKENSNIQFYNQIKSFIKEDNKDIHSIIFSKDRAMQLDGFLSSYFDNVKNYAPISVLYHTSNHIHEKSYEDLKIIYKEKPVNFIKERNFREQLISSIENMREERLIFYVDDMIFSRKIDYNWLSEINPLEDIVCFSRGEDLKYSTVLAKPLNVPQLQKFNENLYRFKWNEIKEFSDWSYPLGVSGYMFSRKEMLSMIKSISFKAPNSLEANLQIFLPYFINRGGICLKDVATPCVHTNITQTEGYNNILGHYTIEELLDIWNKNQRINYTEFLGLPVNEAETKKYSFIERYR